MADFDKAFDITMAHEGGYSNDPVDMGGETYMGIARRYHPRWEGWPTIDRIKADIGHIPYGKKFPELDQSVRRYYKPTFWDPLRGDAIPDQLIAEELFDTGVNMGVSRASRFLQTTLNCLNRNGQLYPDIDEDGDIGPATLGALNKLLPKEASLVYKVLNILQGCHYINFMRSNTEQERFARGWMQRVNFIKT
jgi:lysozyme family protein